MRNDELGIVWGDLIDSQEKYPDFTMTTFTQLLACLGSIR